MGITEDADIALRGSHGRDGPAYLGDLVLLRRFELRTY